MRNYGVYRHMIHLKTHGLMLLCALMLLVAAPDAAFATQQFGGVSAVPHGTCTTDPQFVINTPAPGQGLISSIVTEIQRLLNASSEALFNTITGDSGFIQAVQATVTLYIVIYGILFTFGLVQITLYDFSVRMIKIGLIFLFISPVAWLEFNTYVVTFFNAGTDEFINRMMGVALNLPVAPGAPPFSVVDAALSKAISAKMAVTLMAAFFTPPYGPIFGLLLAMAMGTFVRAIMTAAWVYLMALILKALLFGIAPIFFVFMLFARTRYLFDGWLNQIVNATLQPIFLFTFFAFFVKLMEAGIDQIFMTPVCWTEWGDSLRGSPFSVHYWRFALCQGASCEPFGGKWSWNGPSNIAGQVGAPIFPIDIVGILVLVMLADLCVRFNTIVTMIASDIAAASTNISGMQSALSGWFSQAQKSMSSPSGSGVATLPNQNMSNATQNAQAATAARPAGVTPAGGAGAGGAAAGGGSTSSTKQFTNAKGDTLADMLSGQAKSPGD